MHEDKYILEFDEVKEILNGIGRDKLYRMLKNAYRTGKPFPVLSKYPYRVPKQPFIDALNNGKIKF